MSTVELVIDGEIFAGWKSARIERSIEQISGAFVLELTERFPGQQIKWKIECGAQCSLHLDGIKVITGAVDRSERSGSATQLQLSVNGRDRTADLVDCSACRADGSTGEINGVRLDALAKILVKGYNVGVTVAAGLDLGAPFATWSIEPGETIHDSLERAARQRAVLLTSDGLGNLVITRAGKTRNPVALVEGENLLTWNVVRDDSQRHYNYLALGQSSETDSGRYSERAKDAAIRTNRRLIIVAEDLATGITLRERIQWERNIRRARGRQISVTVAGFGGQNKLWNPNELVSIRIPSADIDANLLIVSVVQSIDEKGATSTLTLAPADAYDLLAEPDPKGAAGGLTL